MATTDSTATNKADQGARVTPLRVLPGDKTDDTPGKPIQQRLAAAHFSELEVAFDPRDDVLWYYMNPLERPCATEGLMQDIKEMQAIIRQEFVAQRHTDEIPVRYLVLASRVPGIFNLGGNLRLFADLISQRDRKGLEEYARLSIDVIHTNSINLNLPLITVSLVQGDALGGGFEAALSSNVIVAERRSRFGLPEILFGLFPGMGAYSFLARRLGPVETERMIFSGRVYTAEEMHDMGVVDVLAEDNFGEEAVLEYISDNAGRHPAQRSIYQVRQRVNPITYQEMMDIAEIWVEAALAMQPADIKKMNRLAAAQDRRQRKAQMTLSTGAE